MENVGKKYLGFENAHIFSKNFAGDKFGRGGYPSFCIRIDKDTADDLAEEGWNVGYIGPKEDGDEPTYYIAVNINFDYYEPPMVYWINDERKKKIKMDKNDICKFDKMKITSADIVVNPRKWTKSNGDTGVTGWVTTLYAHIDEDYDDDPFAHKYDYDEESELPFN